MKGGIVEVTTAVSVGALTQEGGTIRGAGSLTVSGVHTWTSGTLAVATVNVGGGLSLGGSLKYLGSSAYPSSMTLNADGTWSAGSFT